MTAPAMRPPTSAAPTESTPSTTTSAINPPIGKPTRIATGHRHIRRAVFIMSPGLSMTVPPPCEAAGVASFRELDDDRTSQHSRWAHVPVSAVRLHLGLRPLRRPSIARRCNTVAASRQRLRRSSAGGGTLDLAPDRTRARPTGTEAQAAGSAILVQV